MERITGGEFLREHLAGALLAERGIDRGPVRRQLRAPFETPVGVGCRNEIAFALRAEAFEQPAADDFAEFRFIVRKQVARDPLHRFGDAFLPALLVSGHFQRRRRKAEHDGNMARAGGGADEIVEKCMEGVGERAVAIHEVQHFIHQHQDGRAGLGEQAGEGGGAGRIARVAESAAPSGADAPKVEPMAWGGRAAGPMRCRRKRRSACAEQRQAVRQ